MFNKISEISGLVGFFIDSFPEDVVVRVLGDEVILRVNEIVAHCLKFKVFSSFYTKFYVMGFHLLLYLETIIKI